MTQTTLLLAFLVLSSLACQQPGGGETSRPAPAPVPASEPEPAADTEPAVEYEPAYPTDVSSEELSESDVAQQETHSHGEGEAHSHDEGDHENGEQHAHDGRQH